MSRAERAARSRASQCPGCRASGICLSPDTCEVACHAGKDGECHWHLCPQTRDREPHTTGRHCPRDLHDDQDWFVCR